MFIIIKIFNTFFTVLLFFTIFICVFFIPTYSPTTHNPIINATNSQNLLWPTPNIYKINSYFGKRVAPTTGASTYHKGIDIGAPEGFAFIAVTDGVITFVGFLGGGGYTITLQNDIYTISYCHVSPLFTVSVGDFVSQGEHIGSVGPKNVYGVINNPYRDSNGNPTNGATTGPHLHFTLKINNQAVNPLDYLSF